MAHFQNGGRNYWAKKGRRKHIVLARPLGHSRPRAHVGHGDTRSDNDGENMTDKNLKNDTNLTTNHQSDEATADKALFISEWKVNAGETLLFPVQGRKGEIVVDWGDGSSDTISSGDDAYISHEYSNGGGYTIKVDGTIARWSCEFDSDDDDRIRANSKKLIRILSYGKTSFGFYTFKHACNLVGLPENESPRFFENKMTGVFYRASKFNQSINNWDTSNVTNMSEMFDGASSFNQPLNDWDTSNVTDMSEMFSGASSFDQPLNDWNTSNVTDMNAMFYGAWSFNQPLDKWGISDVTDLSEMIDDEDASNADEMFTSVWRVDSNESLFFPIQGREGEIVIDWGDGSSDTINSGDDEYISHDYDEDGFYIIKVDGMITKWSCDLDLGEGCYDEDADDEEDYTDINSHKLIKILSYGKTSFGPYAFMRACNLVCLPRFESPRFFENKMEGVFCRASRFNQSINHWDTSKITNMNSMFSGASSFNQPLNDWDTSNVTIMCEMFRMAKAFNQPLDKWNTSNVTYMNAMFWNAESFNQPLDNWNTSNVTDMSNMFTGAQSFNQPLNDWDTSNVTDMCGMFEYAENFDQPLDKWDVSNVEDMDYIFNNSGLDEDNYSLLLNGPFSERWAELLDE